MKKVMAFLLASAMALGLAACSGGGNTATSSTGTGASASSGAKKTYTIATVPKLTGIAWFTRMEVGVKQFKSDTGMNAYFTGPATADAALQSQSVEDLIAKKVDAICVVPFSTDSLEPALKKARDAGIKVITQEAPTMTNIDYDIEAFNNADYGEAFMKKLGSLTGGKGNYIQLVGSLTSETHKNWTDAAYAYQQKNYPDLKRVGDKIETSDNQNNSYNKVKEALKAHPEINAIEGSAMSDVVGASLAIEELGLSGKVKLVGTSMYSVAGKYVKDGTCQLIQLWDPATAGYAMNVLAVKLLNGETVSDGANLTAKGYTSCKLSGKVLTGNQWLTIDSSNVDDSSIQF